MILWKKITPYRWNLGPSQPNPKQGIRNEKTLLPVVGDIWYAYEDETPCISANEILCVVTENMHNHYWKHLSDDMGPYKIAQYRKLANNSLTITLPGRVSLPLIFKREALVKRALWFLMSFSILSNFF